MLKHWKLPFMAALTVFILVLSAGCGGNPASSNNATSVHADGSQGTNSTSATAEKDTEPAKEVELLVSAAASLTESLNELKTVYEAEHSQVKLIFNYAASGTLQQQIEQGAPADLFLSAGTKQMDVLVDKGFMNDSLTANLLTNELVLIVPKDGSVEVQTMEDLINLAISPLAHPSPFRLGNTRSKPLLTISFGIPCNPGLS
ncbi:hypothetical protein HMSSN139_33180 [Paenibacillus sp. HMSSN-139]|nr:hypothetical protein HMSSN139_33180 [Paenibacillus sp. HMSSN-139]